MHLTFQLLPEVLTKRMFMQLCEALEAEFPDTTWHPLPRFEGGFQARNRHTQAIQHVLRFRWPRGERSEWPFISQHTTLQSWSNSDEPALRHLSICTPSPSASTQREITASKREASTFRLEHRKTHPQDHFTSAQACKVIKALQSTDLLRFFASHKKH